MDTQLEQSTFSMSCKLSEGLVERKEDKTGIMKVYIYSKIVEVGVAISINILSLQMR